MESDHVRQMEYCGKKYLKSQITNVVYNMEEEEIGVWNEKSQSIDLMSESDEEYE